MRGVVCANVLIPSFPPFPLPLWRFSFVHVSRNHISPDQPPSLFPSFGITSPSLSVSLSLSFFVCNNYFVSSSLMVLSPSVMQSV